MTPLPGQRKTDRLLTLDRGLLLLAISAGMWAGVASTKADNQASAIASVESRLKDHENQHNAQELEMVGDLATLKQQIRSIEGDTSKIDANLSKLATSVAKVVNQLPDYDD